MNEVLEENLQVADKSLPKALKTSLKLGKFIYLLQNVLISNFF